LNNPGIILQARTTSKRFPNKCFGLLKAKPIIEWVVETCLESGYPICLAIPINKTNDGLEVWFNDYKILNRGTGTAPSSLDNFTLFRGSEEDVTARFSVANEKLKFDPIIRVCADAPYIAVEDIRLALKIYTERKYFIWLNHVQVFSKKELAYALRADPNIESRQHVGGHFMHSTVDTVEDLVRFNTTSDDPTIQGRMELWNRKKTSRFTWKWDASG